MLRQSSSWQSVCCTEECITDLSLELNQKLTQILTHSINSSHKDLNKIFKTKIKGLH